MRAALSYCGGTAWPNLIAGRQIFNPHREPRYRLGPELFDREVPHKTLHAQLHIYQLTLGLTNEADVRSVSIAAEVEILFRYYQAELMLLDVCSQKRCQEVPKEIVALSVARDVYQLPVHQFVVVCENLRSRSKSSIVKPVASRRIYSTPRRFTIAPCDTLSCWPSCPSGWPPPI
jgi:hypothetical protein